MTENKPIMIDGVDVSGCRYLFDDTSYKKSKTACSITLKDCKYLGNKCYYKQLVRKTQECQQLINKNNRLNEELNTTKLLLEGKNNQYTAKTQECEDLKAGIKHYKQIAQYHGNLSVKYTNKSARLKQALAEIKKIAEGMHDLWINKTPYTDKNNLVEHLLECELNRIRYKLDETSEREGRK